MSESRLTSKDGKKTGNPGHLARKGLNFAGSDEGTIMGEGIVSPVRRNAGLSRRGWFILITATLLLAGGGYYAYWSEVEHRFMTVTKHQLYQSGRMNPDELLRVAAKHGIRSVIDLRTIEDDAVGIEAERNALENSEVTFFHLPTGHVPNEQTVLSFLNIVGNPANRPALVHCYHGTGRSVLFASLYRIEFENWDNETARRAVEPLHWRGNFGPDSAKGQYLISYVPHGARVVFASSNAD